MQQTLKLELDEDRVVDMAKAVDADGSGDMGFDEFLEVIMIVHEMKRLGCPRAEVMLPGDPDAPCFLLERNGEGRHVGKEMADVAVRKLFQGLPSNRLDEVSEAESNATPRPSCAAAVLLQSKLISKLRVGCCR